MWILIRPAELIPELDLQWRAYLGDQTVLQEPLTPADRIYASHSLFCVPGIYYPTEPVQLIRERALFGMTSLSPDSYTFTHYRYCMAGGLQGSERYVVYGVTPNLLLTEKRYERLVRETQFAAMDPLTLRCGPFLLPNPSILAFRGLIHRMIYLLLWLVCLPLAITVRWMNIDYDRTSHWLQYLAYWNCSPSPLIQLGCRGGQWEQEHLEQHRLQMPDSLGTCTVYRTLRYGGRQTCTDPIADRLDAEPLGAGSWRYADHPGVWERAVQTGLVRSICTCTLVTAAIHDNLPTVERTIEIMPLTVCHHLPGYLLRPEVYRRLAHLELERVYHQPERVCKELSPEDCLVMGMALDLPVGLTMALYYRAGGSDEHILPTTATWPEARGDTMGRIMPRGEEERTELHYLSETLLTEAGAVFQWVSDGDLTEVYARTPGPLPTAIPDEYDPDPRIYHWNLHGSTLVPVRLNLSQRKELRDMTRAKPKSARSSM